MKKTQRKELFANILRSKVSFISITMFIILGIAIFLGLGWIGDDLRGTLNVEDHKGNAHDVELFFPYGITNEDIKTLNGIEEIEEVEPYFVAYESFEVNDFKREAKLVSLNSNIDKIIDIEGRLPQNENEILAERGSADNLGIKVGDSFEFYGEEANTSYLINVLKQNPESAIDELENIDDLHKNYLKSKKLTVVGIGETPEYFSISGTSYGQSTFTSAQVSAVFFVDHSAFNEEVTGPYNYLAIRYKGLNDLSYTSDEYADKVVLINNKLKPEFNKLSTLSYSHIVDGYNDIDKYLQDKLADAKKQIEDAKIEISKNEKKLKDAKVELDKAKQELADAEAQIEEGEKKLKAGEAEYAKFLALVNKVKNTYEKYKDIAEKGKDGKAQPDDILKVLMDEDIGAFSDLLEYGTSTGDLSEADLTEFKGFGNTVCEEFIDFFYDYAHYVVNYLNLSSIPDDPVAMQAAMSVSGICTYDASYSGLSEAAKLDVNVDKVDQLSESHSGKTDVKVLDDVYKKAKERYGDGTGSYTEKGGDSDLILNVNLRTSQLFLKLAEETGSSTILTIYQNAVKQSDKALAEARSELDSGWRKLKDAKYLYESGKIEYEKGLAEYNSGIKKIAQAKIDLADGEKEYADGEADYKEFKDRIGNIKDYGTIYLSQEDNTAMMYNTMLADIIGRIKIILGGLFLAIGLVVCYSVVTRMVNDDVKLIGTKKAIGFNRKEITKHYLLYTAITVILGGLIGLAIAIYIIEPIVAPSATSTFTYSLAGNCYDLKEFALLFGAELLLIEIITYLACRRLLRKDAIKLLQSETTNRYKVRFYEKLGIYKRLPLLTKTIINNFVNDRSRILATLIGIAGSTALVVAALTMRGNVLKCFDSQFTEYFVFDSFVYFDQENDDAKENIYEVLDKYELTYTPIQRQFGYSDKDDIFSNLFTYVMVYDENDPNFEKLVNFVSVDGETYDNGETWMSNATQQWFDLGNKSTINFRSMTGEEGNVEVHGFYNYYYYSSMLFMSHETYKETFGRDVVENIILVNTDGIDKTALINDLKKTDGYQNFLDFEAYVGEDAKVFKTIANMLVGVYGSAAILMSVFVILNLLITFVNEKKKELIVLMINGFSIKQAKRYIYSDTILLTIVGIIVGCLVGTLAGDKAITSFESIYLYLKHEPNLMAIVLGSVMTTILTIIMSIIALKGIERFKLTEINKD